MTDEQAKHYLMAHKPKRATKPTSKKPATIPKTRKPRRKPQPGPAWWTTVLDYLGNYILLTLAVGLVLWLALIFRDAFDWLLGSSA